MGRSACCSKVGLRRGPWSAKEDSLLASFIQQNGEGQWRSLPKKAGLLRCGKSCRLRWMNYLRPGIKRGNISEDEEDLIVRLHGLLGNRWSLIAGRLPGRTDNEIKNYWNTHLLKKLAAANKPPAAAKPKKKKPPPQKKKKADTPTVAAAEVETQKSKVYLPKPIRVSPGFPRAQSYDSLASGSSSSEGAAEVVVSAWPLPPQTPTPLLFGAEDPPVLYHFSDSISDDVNMWEQVYAEYMQLL